MNRVLPILLLLFITSRTHAQCDPSFTTTINQSTVVAHATVTASNVYHYWDFGGLGSASGYGATISNNYAQPGVYIIKHLVFDSLRTCRDSSYQTVVVNFTVSCQASFTAVRDSISPNTYRFTSTSSVTGGIVQTYKWTIGSTLLSYGSSVTRYVAPGTSATICLEIITTGGCTSSTCQTITTPALTRCNLSPNFTATNSATNLRLLSFTPSPLAANLRYSWSFGDGSAINKQATPVHLYPAAGTYTVNLRVIDSIAGCYDTLARAITVQGYPSDSCTLSYTSAPDPAHPNVISYTAVSNQPVTSQYWTVYTRDSSFNYFDSTAHPVITFPHNGTYYLCVTIHTNTGCVRSLCDSVVITGLGARTSDLIVSYPNPANERIVNVRLQLPQPERITVRVYSTSGFSVYNAERSGTQGLNTIQVPLSGLQRGQYFIDIQYGSERKHSTFQKL